MKPFVNIMYFPGTNCEQETVAAFELAGAQTQLVFVNDLLSGRTKITDCDICCFPGGFSFGDHIGTGVVAATLIRDHIPQLVEKNIPTLGICNGFQILMRAGVFCSDVTLTDNDSGVFCSRPVHHRILASDCVWTRGIEDVVLSFPCAHGGGKVIGVDRPASATPALVYEGFSPNGGTIAGFTANDGLILGLMDHPERPYGNSDGQEIFRRGIQHVTWRCVS